MEDLNRALDIAKSSMFLNKNAAFLAPVMCSMNFTWDESIPTAATNGVALKINPTFFKDSDKEKRKFIILHEIWHTARLHHIRGEGKDPKTWNIACDIIINNDLKRNMIYVPNNAYVDLSIGDISEEELYEILLQSGNSSGDGYLSGDLEKGQKEVSNDNELKQQITNIVTSALEQAKLADSFGSVPGSIRQFMDKFLAPSIPWNVVLQNYLTDLQDHDYSWSRPNRRYSDMYLPGKVPNEGRLEHLAFFMDVSGSISDEEIIRFNSEIKYIQEVLNPKKLTLIQFDTEIQDIRELVEGEPFKSIDIIGRGGTSLSEVYKWIINNNPTASVIFSDLECRMMKQPKSPVIWAIINNPHKIPPFGKTIHVEV